MGGVGADGIQEEDRLQVCGSEVWLEASNVDTAPRPER